jgi:hypothetical protein
MDILEMVKLTQKSCCSHLRLSTVLLLTSLFISFLLSLSLLFASHTNAGPLQHSEGVREPHRDLQPLSGLYAQRDRHLLLYCSQACFIYFRFFSPR